MNLTTTLNKVTPFQQLCAALFLIAVGFSTGYTASEIQHPVTFSDEVKDFDIFAYKAQNEVAPIMEEVMKHPTEYNLRSAKNTLNIGIRNSAAKEAGENKELFEEYRFSCVAVIDSLQDEESKKEYNKKVDKMNSLYTKLN